MNDRERHIVDADAVTLVADDCIYGAAVSPSRFVSLERTTRLVFGSLLIRKPAFKRSGTLLGVDHLASAFAGMLWHACALSSRERNLLLSVLCGIRNRCFLSLKLFF